jgi:nucleoside-diphosphate-sugar epimerase
MKIFLTGISGFLGETISEILTNQGHELAALSRNVTIGDKKLEKKTNNINSEIKKIKYYHGDLSDFLAISDILKDFQPEVIIHLAAQTSVSYSFTHMKEVFDVNFMGVFNIAEAARRELPNLKRFIWSGSVEEYGIQHNNNYPITEDEVQLHPVSPYGIAKIAAENFLKFLFQAYGFPSIIFRNANSYGRKFNHKFVVESIIFQMIQGKHLIKLGDPEPIRDFIFKDDLVNAYVLAVECENKEILGEAINITTNEPISIKNLAEKIKKITDYNGEIQWNNFPKRIIEIPKLNTDNLKAKKLLNWSPKFTLDEGLKITVSYYTKI